MAQRSWISQRAGTSGHQWSALSTDTLSPWYDNGAQTALASYPGAAPGTNQDIVTQKHAITLDVSATIGYSLQQSALVPVTIANTGSATTKLATGVYKITYTTVSANGETSVGLRTPTIELTTGTLTNGTSVPRVTFPNGAPPAGCTYNLYLTQAAGSSGTERLFCTGISGATVDLVGAVNGSDSFWGNAYSTGVASGGTTAFASATPTTSLLFANRAALNMTTAGALTINSGITLTLRGDFGDVGNTASGVTITAGSGSSIVFDPTQAVDRTTANYIYYADTGAWVLNGSNGSPVAVSTLRTNGDEARAVCFSDAGNRLGIRTATYANFTDLGAMIGTTSVAYWGVKCVDNVSASTQAYSFTNCNFLRANFFQGATLANYDGNFTFQYNTFTSTLLMVFAGPKSYCAQFNFTGSPSTSTRLIDSNQFEITTPGGSVTDAQVGFFHDFKIKKTNNTFGGGWNPGGNSLWPDDSYCNNNIFYFNSNTVAATGMFFYGPWLDCYFYCWDPSAGGNVHMSSPKAVASIATYTVKNNIYECIQQQGQGNCITIRDTGFPNPSTMTCTGNISIAAQGGNYGACEIGPDDFSGGFPTVTAEHNTGLGSQKTASGIYWGEFVAPAAGQLTSYQANLIANYWSAPDAYLVALQANNHTVTDAITVAGYNGVYNPTTGSVTCSSNSGTITTSNVSAAVTGVSTLFLSELAVGSVVKTSGGTTIGTVTSITDNTHLTFTGNAATTNAGISWSSTSPTVAYNAFTTTAKGFPNAQFGTGDITGSTSAFDPMFLDKTRCMGKWGQVVKSVSAGSDNGVSETLAYFAANLATASADIPAMMLWVRTGYQPTVNVYATSYPGDTSTVDANGNPWPGGMPGMGAVRWAPPYSPWIYGDQIQEMYG